MPALQPRNRVLAPGLELGVFAHPTSVTTRFGPSAVARLPGGRVVVASDRDDAPQLVFCKVGPRDELIAERAASLPGSAKIEGMTASRREPRTLYVTGSFEGGFAGDADKRLVRVRLDARLGIAGIEKLPIDPPAAVARLLGFRWSKVEGLALSPSERELMVGVLAVGQSWRQPERRVLILAYDLADPAKLPRVLVNVDLTRVLGRAEGISSLEWSAERNVWLLATSYEGAGGVGGHLWVAPRLEALNDAAAWRGLERIRFAHKPEGVESLPDGRLLVVFDDDDHKSAAPEARRDRMPLRREQAAFALWSGVDRYGP